MTHPNYTQPSPISRFFQYSHLPDNLRRISQPFSELAEYLDTETSDDNPETGMALRKLLEAKDCAVRAFLLEDDAR
jgi:hypothetical protein